MKRFVNVLCCATALVGVNAGTIREIAAQEFSWSGFYTGVLGGVGRTTFEGNATAVGEGSPLGISETLSTDSYSYCDSSYYDVFTTSGTDTYTSQTFSTYCYSGTYTLTGSPDQYVFDDEDFSISDEGFLAGWRNGAQAEIMPGIVIGGVLDLLLGDFEAEYEFEGDSYALLTLSLDQLATARGLVGVPVGAVMPYVTAGAAAGHVKGTLETYFDNDYRWFHDEDYAFGYAAGAGVQVQATPNLWLDFTYLHVGLAETSFVFEDDGDIYGTADFTTSSDIFTVGVLFKAP